MTRVLYIAFLLIACLPSRADDKDSALFSRTNEIYSFLDSDSEKALKLTKQLRAEAKTSNRYYHEANALYIQGWLLEKSGNSGEAFAKFIEGLTILGQNNLIRHQEKDLKARLLMEVSSSLKRHNENQASLKYLEETVDYCINNDLKKRLCNAYHYLATIYSEDFSNKEVALEYIKRELFLAKEIENNITFYRALNYQGLILTEMGDYEKARLLFKQVIELSDDEQLSLTARHNIGHTYHLENRLPQALEAYINSEQAISKSVYTTTQFLTWMDLCEVNLKLNNLKEAEYYGQKAETVFNEVELKPTHYKLFETMASVYFQNGEYQKSFEYSQKHFTANTKFLKNQEELIRIKSEYSMYTLAAGFLTGISKEGVESNYYTIILSIISGILTCLILIGLTLEHNKKRALKKAVLHIYSKN